MKTLQVHEQLSFDFKSDVVAHQVHEIKGELITASIMVNAEETLGKDETALKAEIKKRLTKILADEIARKISFSFSYDPSLHTRKYMGRVFLTPSDQVQKIRELIVK